MSDLYLHYVDLDMSIVDFFGGIINKIIQDKDPVDLKNLSTSGGGIQYDLYKTCIVDPHENLNPLEPISSYIKNIICETGVTSSIDNLNLASSWTVLGKRGSYHTCHKHNTNKDVSTVLYLETPQTNDERDEGIFYFVINNEVHELVPKKGRLLIFPVTMYHGVYPQGDGLRQTLNMDFSLQEC